ncbi:MAG: hypothetical protein Q9203_003798 [Teloschistes exilis]
MASNGDLTDTNTSTDGGQNNATVGGSLVFLKRDAAITRKSFVTWYRHTYPQTQQSLLLSKDGRVKINELCQALAGASVDRNSLRPDVAHVLEAWEALPLVEGFPEWSQAQTRLVAKLVLEGKLREYQAQGLEVAPEELAQARHWLHKTAYRKIVSYQPLRQAWCHKELEWDPAAGGLKTVVPGRVPSDRNQLDNYQGPEGVRIARKTFAMLVENCGPRISVRQDRRPERPNNDDEVIDVSENEPDSQDQVALHDLPLYLGVGTREEPFLADRMEEPPADRFQLTPIKQEPPEDTEANSGASDDRGATHQDENAPEAMRQRTSTNGNGDYLQQSTSASEGSQNRHSHRPTHSPADVRMSIEDSADDGPPHEDQRAPSVAISEASTAMAEGAVEGDDEESEKENAARSYTYRRDSPITRQDITSAAMISPIRTFEDEDELMYGHTSPDSMDLHRAVEDLHMQNRSVLRARRREPTPIDITGGDEDDDAMDDALDAYGRPNMGYMGYTGNNRAGRMDLEEEELDEHLPLAIRRALRANAEGHQPNIPGGNKRRRI